MVHEWESGVERRECGCCFPQDAIEIYDQNFSRTVIEFCARHFYYSLTRFHLRDRCLSGTSWWSATRWHLLQSICCSPTGLWSSASNLGTDLRRGNFAARPRCNQFSCNSCVALPHQAINRVIMPCSCEVWFSENFTLFLSEIIEWTFVIMPIDSSQIECILLSPLT